MSDQLEQRREYMDSRQNRTTVVEMDYTVSSVKSNGESTLERTQGRRSLAGVVYGPPIGSAPGHYKNPPLPGSPEPRITRSVGSDFQKKSTNSVLEVLLEEPRISVRSRVRKSSLAVNGSLDGNGHSKSTPNSPVIHQNPKRIRIRSPKLLAALETAAQTSGHSFITSGTSSIVCYNPSCQSSFLLLL